MDQVHREAERLHEDILHTKKSLFAAAGGWNTLHLLLGVPATVAGVVAASIADARIVAGLAAAGLAGLLTFLNPQHRAATHLADARTLASLRGRLRRFINLDLKADEPDLRERLEVYASEKDTTVSKLPPIPRWAYLLGRGTIRKGEHAYRVDPSGS